jgi:hypothetical protein
MKNISLIILVLMTTISLSSFTPANNNEFIGTYGAADSNVLQIKLTINSDNTFYYQDFSDANNKIIAQGTWVLNGQKVILQDSNSNDKFHTVWTFDEKGNVAHSRKGLCFYRLCKVSE